MDETKLESVAKVMKQYNLSYVEQGDLKVTMDTQANRQDMISQITAQITERTMATDEEILENPLHGLERLDG